MIPETMKLDNEDIHEAWIGEPYTNTDLPANWDQELWKYTPDLALDVDPVAYFGPESKKLMRVRVAVEADIPEIVRLGLDFYDGSPYKEYIDRSPEHIEWLAMRLVGDPASVVLLAEDEGKAIGMIGLMTYPHPISGEPFAGELFWWVEPTHRGGAGVKLLKMAEVWAKSKGAKKIQMVAPDPQVEKLYQRLGYTAVEVQYQRTL